MNYIRLGSQTAYTYTPTPNILIIQLIHHIWRLECSIFNKMRKACANPLFDHFDVRGYLYPSILIEMKSFLSFHASSSFQIWWLSFLCQRMKHFKSIIVNLDSITEMSFLSSLRSNDMVSIIW